MQKNSIDDRMENAADYGEMDINLYLWKKSIKRLRKNGLVVTERYPSKRKGEVYCNISWAYKVEGQKLQVNNLHEMALSSIRRKEARENLF